MRGPGCLGPRPGRKPPRFLGQNIAGRVQLREFWILGATWGPHFLSSATTQENPGSAPELWMKRYRLGSFCPPSI